MTTTRETPEARPSGVDATRPTGDLRSAAAGPLARRLSPKYMEQHSLLPLELQNGTLLVAAGSPLDPATIDELSWTYEARVKLVDAPAAEIHAAIMSVAGSTGGGLPADLQGADVQVVTEEEEAFDDVRALATQAPVIKLVNVMILEALKSRASDLHLESTPEGLRVRHRIDGVLHDVSRPPKAYQSAAISRIKIMANLNIAERRLPQDGFPGGGPTALAEFFGDHMVVNGKIWPKENVEPRNYRMRLLNGTDSRFMVIQFVAVNAGDTDFTNAGAPIPFWVIGSDQGLGTPAQTDTLVFEPGGRYDIVFDFSDPALEGKRVIMKNIGGDEPFGGDIPGPQAFGETDRVMAFDVVVPRSGIPDRFDPISLPGYDGVANGATTRRVALFEGTDEFGRLQPLLGTVKDGNLNTSNVATAYTWFQPTTETPALDSTEIWEIYNFTADAHPIHLHLVNFQILDRKDFEYDITGTQTTTQHNGTTGEAPEISNIRNLTPTSVGSEYFEDAPKDMVTSLPGDPEGTPPTGQMVRIKAHFDKPGRYVWHCHILSHEDHEMMRVLQVGGDD
ncbi:MAG: multicopper oxidase domain-containing protein [Gemmatimonadetes bacterium]|uniref:Multicopper oxidase domain-containing protein n=1 Tax=Candidatus Kutchimonas denitrificans TaxID=3056748 RepID=A0AAE4Z9E7_9BACT|nr:multicopper oxidase domain-containing protein [Gemmatimonadota bacterium]NIR74932.1 multicopper oxidase domain-containing protein [Candidatus Kutchimonas denitrificans]NIS00044.1 multicopper oxidase domain-containing protein [Gemmatimonadota bacterium]NIT65627.1 multicopper oxidase domain-containing protein [Gemmatimonadota bacterium]NIU52597.1 multicopper oxidase domain-containing protein [Gemmatimonadota bacterium]